MCGKKGPLTGVLVCTEVIRNKGIDQVTVEDLIEEITPKGRGRQKEPWLDLWLCVSRITLTAISSCLMVRTTEQSPCLGVAASVPESVKSEMLANIKAFIEKAA